mmetsp:Transcript_1381/g.1893  ORF Transcript_1381/g.1893 Transcript_1381/m.1893 type:complete len:114 (-) Transcript_1381:144-485(-)
MLRSFLRRYCRWILELNPYLIRSKTLDFEGRNVVVYTSEETMKALEAERSIRTRVSGIQSVPEETESINNMCIEAGLQREQVTGSHEGSGLSVGASMPKTHTSSSPFVCKPCR